MKRNPWLDRYLPPDADEDRIRFVYSTVLPAMPPDQKQYAARVLAALPACPPDLLSALLEITNG